MNKKILVLYYSQSGQLGEIVTSLSAPLKEAGHYVEIVQVKPAVAYPFPWSGKSFFEVMPDCVHENPVALQPIQWKEKKYDLVVLGYQAWFLSPSIPSNSILNDPEVQAAIKNTPVVTITGARNMWISALTRIRVKLKDTGAVHAGNIVLVDKHANLVSFVTILYWMFTGKRDRYLNIFPKPGVSEKDIENCKVYGGIIEKYLRKESFTGMQNELLQKKAVVVKYSLMFIESKAKRIFKLWANFISKRKNRTPWLVAFKYYLIIALFVAAPVILTVNGIFFKPFSGRRIKKQKEFFSGIN